MHQNTAIHTQQQTINNQQQHNHPKEKDNFYQIESKCAGRLLDMCQDGQNKGKLIIYDRWGSNNQHFAIIHSQNMQVLFKNKASGLFLTVANNSDKNGSIIVQLPFQDLPSQKFRLQEIRQDSGQFVIFTYSGKVLDICENSYKNNTRIIQWDFHGKENQRWYIKKVA